MAEQCCKEYYIAEDENLELWVLENFPGKDPEVWTQKSNWSGINTREWWCCFFWWWHKMGGQRTVLEGKQRCQSLHWCKKFGKMLETYVRTRKWLGTCGIQSLGWKCWQYPIRRCEFVQSYLGGRTPARSAVEYLLHRDCCVPLCQDMSPILESRRVLTGPYKSWLWLLCGFGKSSAAKKQKISNLRNSRLRTSQSCICSGSWQLRPNSIPE